MEAKLTRLVEHYLALHLFDNAIFMAERLFAHSASEESRHTLANCLLRAGNVHQAVLVLSQGRSPASRYLHAKYSLDIGQRQAAEDSLLRGSGLQGKPISDIMLALQQDPSRVPNGPAGIFLLGQCASQAGRYDRAGEYFGLALQLDPFLWCAYEALCRLGKAPDAALCFAPTRFEESGHNAAQAATPAPSATVPAPLAYLTPAAPASKGAQPSSRRYTEPTVTPLTLAETPSGTAAAAAAAPLMEGPRAVQSSPLIASASRFGFMNMSAISPVAVQDESVRLPPQATDTASPRARKASAFATPAAPQAVRQAGRGAIIARSMSSKDVRSAVPVRARVNFAPSTVKAQELQASNAAAQNPSALKGIRAVLSMLREFGNVYLHLCKYECAKAVEAIANLPTDQQSSGWAQHMLGRAYFEMAQYAKAKKAFECMRRVAPERVAGLEVYSTVLWHLRDDVELTTLSHFLMTFDTGAAETWCAAGNCFSLKRDHALALTYINRAIKLHPTCAYAHTLAGHERLALGMLEDAATSFSAALQYEPRHYNAWYGLGTVYVKQGELLSAAMHYRKALEINPRSAILHCYLGMVLSEEKKYDAALQMFNEASRIDPAIPQAMYQRSKVYMALGKYQLALEELKAVHDCAPMEPQILRDLGKVYKRLGRLSDATMYWNMALEQSKGEKDANVIKNMLQSVSVPGDDDDLLL